MCYLTKFTKYNACYNVLCQKALTLNQTLTLSVSFHKTLTYPKNISLPLSIKRHKNNLLSGIFMKFTHSKSPKISLWVFRKKFIRLMESKLIIFINVDKRPIHKIRNNTTLRHRYLIGKYLYWVNTYLQNFTLAFDWKYKNVIQKKKASCLFIPQVSVVLVGSCL